MATQITHSYPVEVKRQLMSAIKPVFDPETYPDPELAGEISVTLDWPQKQIHFPAVYITYTEGTIQNMGVGHREYALDDQNNPVEVRHWNFTGQVNFNILALNPLERDNLSAGVVNLLAFSEVIDDFSTFKEEVSDEDFAYVVLMTETITAHGQNTTPVPWGNQDEMVFSSTYSVPAYGEFWTDPYTGSLVQISGVNVYPYRFDQPAPW